jgi:hypothetical protein
MKTELAKERVPLVGLTWDYVSNGVRSSSVLCRPESSPFRPVADQGVGRTEVLGRSPYVLLPTP